MFLLFLIGLTLAFTPCVLPMLPIVANIVAHQKTPTTGRSFALSSAYGVGVATAYGLLGALLAYAGESMGLLLWLQSPLVLLTFAGFFVLLGLYMLDVISLRLPASISQKLHNISQSNDHKLGSISGSFIVGLLSALVVSPCVSAPLSGALVAVASLGNVWLGFIALFMLGMGLSLPLILFATTEGKLLPKAGEWMNWIKYGFAYLMFAVALMMVDRIFQSPLTSILWAVWFVVIAIWAYKFSKHLVNVPAIIAKITAVVAIGVAVACIFSAVVTNDTAVVADNGSQNKSTKPVMTINTVEQLDKVLASEAKVVVDITADWCVECRIMDKELFITPPTQLNNWQLIKFDISDTTDNSKAMLKRYNLVGPPTLLYYVKGQLITKHVGKVQRRDFEQSLTALNDQYTDNN